MKHLLYFLILFFSCTPEPPVCRDAFSLDYSFPLEDQQYISQVVPYVYVNGGNHPLGVKDGTGAGSEVYTGSENITHLMNQDDTVEVSFRYYDSRDSSYFMSRPYRIVKPVDGETTGTLIPGTMADHAIEVYRPGLIAIYENYDSVQSLHIVDESGCNSKTEVTMYHGADSAVYRFTPPIALLHGYPVWDSVKVRNCTGQEISINADLKVLGAHHGEPTIRLRKERDCQLNGGLK